MRLRIPPLAISPRRIGQFLEAVAVYATMAVFACLPIDWASAAGGAIGRAVGPRVRRSEHALRSLARAMPQNSDVENRRIIRAMWDNFGRAVAEHPHLARICAADSDRVEIVNPEGVTALLSDGKPGIVFGGHFANWEIGPTLVHRLMGDSLLSVYRAADNPFVDRLMRRRLHGRRAVPKGAAGGRELLRELSGGGHVAMLVDQKQNDGIAVPFFGRDAMTAPAIGRFALRFHCPVVPIRVERLEGAHFRFTVQPPLDLVETGDTAADTLAAMTRINAIIEEWARARPEQWSWMHRRWPD